MLSISNPLLELSVGEGGGSILLVDKARGMEWRLDPASRVFRMRGAEGGVGEPGLLPEGRVEKMTGAFRVTHLLAEGEVHFLWTLATDHVRVGLEVRGDVVAEVALPGSFSVEGEHLRMLIPSYQGILFRGSGETWEENRVGGAHGNLSLSMAAMVGDRGALLVTQENETDWACRFGEGGGALSFAFHQRRCAVDGWYRREVRLYPVAPDIAAIAKRYRARLKERGEFVSWEEKIARKPILENLFGALHAFLGYNKTSEVDYAGSARKLHEMGFERVLYCPVRMAHWSLDFKMGGDTPIWFTDEEVARIKTVPGALVAPWGWFVEGLDDGSERMARIFRRNAQGGTYNLWRIENQQWKEVCLPYQVEEVRRRFGGDLRAMDWIHYDVSATRLGRPVCFSHDHALHGGRAMGMRADVEWTRRLLGPETNGNRIVSSEGFQDRYATVYDIGSTKVHPAWGHATAWPVPLTMLVLHDSMVHQWWEMDTYNAVPGHSLPLKGSRFGHTGSGGAAAKAAMDALYGSPPQVFPFGRQYGWVDLGSRRSFSYTIQLADREVQRALEAALPMTRLHAKVGKQEMVSFEFLSEDGALQASAFADGTRVVANFSNLPREAAGVGQVPPESWRAAG
jgi:hypothetical protein